MVRLGRHLDERPVTNRSRFTRTVVAMIGVPLANRAILQIKHETSTVHDSERARLDEKENEHRDTQLCEQETGR